MQMAGSLASRGERPLGRYCPIERVLTVISARSAFLILREAMYGATRFDQFAARADLTDATTSARLRDLVDAGLLEKRPYQEPGARRREEYHLSEAGASLMPTLVALLQWGNEHDPPPYPPRVSHLDCGEPVRVEARCSRGHLVGVEDLEVTAPGPFGLVDPTSA